MLYVNRSKEAIVNYVLNAQISRNRYDNRYSNLSWAIQRNYGSSPYSRICRVGKLEVDVLTRFLDNGKIHIIPCSLTSLNLSALIPVKCDQVAAQAWVGCGILHIQAKVDRKVGCNLQVEIFGINLIICISKLLKCFEEVTYYIRHSSTKFQASRNRNGNSGTCSIHTIGYKTEGDMRALVILVSKINA